MINRILKDENGALWIRPETQCGPVTVFLVADLLEMHNSKVTIYMIIKIRSIIEGRVNWDPFFRSQNSYPHGNMLAVVCFSPKEPAKTYDILNSIILAASSSKRWTDFRRDFFRGSKYVVLNLDGIRT